MSVDANLRRELLAKVCKDKGWVKSDGAPSPGKLAAEIDRATNYCSDLLLGRRSFGEEIARHIEQALGLPQWHLDGGAGWPFPHLDRTIFDDLHEWQKMEIQGKVREMVKQFSADNAEATRKRGAA